MSRSSAVARRSGSGSKQRRIKALASGDMDSGISGWILNIPTCTRMTCMKGTQNLYNKFKEMSIVSVQAGEKVKLSCNPGRSADLNACLH